MSEINRFWMVFVEGRNSPKHTHQSLQEAQEEAARLALQEKARCFVLESVGWYEIAPIPVVWQATKEERNETH